MLALLVSLGVIAVSVLLSFLPHRRARVVAILIWWLTPLWLALYLTVADTSEIVFEFGHATALLIFAPIFLALWATVTIFPYKLALRIREINSDK